jgi:hypothetical protein
MFGYSGTSIIFGNSTSALDIFINIVFAVELIALTAILLIINGKIKQVWVKSGTVI